MSLTTAVTFSLTYVILSEVAICIIDTTHFTP